jgi:hypothetical protein
MAGAKPKRCDPPAARSIAAGEVDREDDDLKTQGCAMDRDEYLRRACVLEERAAEFAYPGLRAALLNIAAQYRSLAKQAVLRRAGARCESLRSTALQNWATRDAGRVDSRPAAAMG